MTIALHTMVKDGLAKIPALLESVVGFCDKAIILDTGSTDGTQEYLRTQTILPVELKESAFIDFGASRTEGMEFCKGKADWILLMDDDMRLQAEPDYTFEIARQTLSPEIECYLLRIDQRFSYWTTRIARGDLAWRYIGATHEYLARSEKGIRLGCLSVKHEFKHLRSKFTRDISLLLNDLAKDPSNHRTIFYLAQSFRDSGQLLPAIRFYEMRVRMGGWHEEVYFSMFESARLARDPNAMQQAYAFRPSRAEPAAWLRDYYYNLRDVEKSRHWEEVRKSIPLPSDILFLDTKAYDTH